MPHLVSSSESAIKIVDVLQFLVLLVGEWLDHRPFVFATPVLTFACLVVATVLVSAVTCHYLLPLDTLVSRVEVLPFPFIRAVWVLPFLSHLIYGRHYLRTS